MHMHILDGVYIELKIEAHHITCTIPANTLNYFDYRQMKFPLAIITVSVVALKLCNSSDLELVDPDLGSQ